MYQTPDFAIVLRDGCRCWPVAIRLSILSVYEPRCERVGDFHRSANPRFGNHEHDLPDSEQSSVADFAVFGGAHAVTGKDPRPKERHEIIYSGNVQGVGFRYTARQIAARHPVTGFVQNLPDGRVLLVAEGSQDSVAAFLDGVEGEMARHISTKQANTAVASGDFEDFSVRY
jgi:acylphosphatase